MIQNKVYKSQSHNMHGYIILIGLVKINHEYTYVQDTKSQHKLINENTI